MQNEFALPFFSIWHDDGNSSATLQQLSNKAVISTAKHDIKYYGWDIVARKLLDNEVYYTNIYTFAS